ncbi:type 4 prepilin-like proteins leader peptide processing enzyme [Bordetella ansorpii]|uniref:Prepilin leader peptidase/N-methyltransferase n=1 Tax=Bordetella ansorpii TaxID=288768 RepID=A0A157QUN6_9BORD|nr:A24 family peptidase [Bordetella ansorpii]SAI48659.1 type 4 prepilin-like proteins leader peptide processing enzyme [Bordetella ansorpii]
MWHMYSLDPGLAVLLAALLGLAVSGPLSAVAHRLPRIMEREWQAALREEREAAESPAESAESDAGQPYGLLRPGWHCPSCESPVRGWHATPLVGWLALRGRCADCHAPIGRRYPAFELALAALFAACAWRFGPTCMALCAMGLVGALLVLAWIDTETGLLPDAITLPLAWAGLLVNLGDGLAPLSLAVVGAVAGYLFLWSVFHVFKRVTGREGMGYGDFKLMAALGAWLGVAALPWLLLGASLAGVIVGVGLRVAGRVEQGQPLPFGPYLAAGGILMLLAAGQPPWLAGFG